MCRCQRSVGTLHQRTSDRGRIPGSCHSGPPEEERPFFQSLIFLCCMRIRGKADVGQYILEKIWEMHLVAVKTASGVAERRCHMPRLRRFPVLALRLEATATAGKTVAMLAKMVGTAAVTGHLPRCCARGRSRFWYLFKRYRFTLQLRKGFARE